MRKVALGLAALVGLGCGGHVQIFPEPLQSVHSPTRLQVPSIDKTQPQSLARMLRPLKALSNFLLTLNPATGAFSCSGSLKRLESAVNQASVSRVPCPKAKCVAVIAGPTGVGKSNLAMHLCEQMQGEIISVDSVQVYKKLQIGANKPTPHELDRVPHHLVNLCEPNEEYTAGAFYDDALRAVQDVLSRGRLPVLVGGTSMYLDWFTNGRPDSAIADPEIKNHVHKLLAPFKAANDWESGLAQLQQVDPASAAQLLPNDWYRLHRTLTKVMTKDTASPRFQADTDDLTKFRESLDMRCFFLSAPREPLYRRIDKRCEAMIQKGLLEETTDQLLHGGLMPSSPAGRAIGYRQALDYLTRKKWRYHSKQQCTKFVRDFTQQSRQYAAKQTRWFRTEPKFEWVPVDWELPEHVERRVREHIECDRGDFDRALAAPCQAELRELDRNDKSTEEYLPHISALDRREALNELIERADQCREELQEHLPELLAIDAELAQKFPYSRASV